MERSEFISLIGTCTLVDFPTYGGVQVWSMENFNYDSVTDTISHNRLNLLTDVFLKKATNPRMGCKEEATHG